MQTRSALFDATITRAHTMLAQADILSGGKVIKQGIPLAGGSVTGDRSQFARRTGSVVVPDPAYIPQGSPRDLLAPYGNEIRLWRGAITPVGPELIPLATLGIRSVDYDDGGAFAGITVTGIDRCKRLAETRFPFPRTTPVQFGAINMVRTLILEVFPAAEIRVSTRLVDQTLPQATWQSDRAQAITDIMTSLGGEMYCDPMGGFVLRPVPSPSGTPVYTVTSGVGGVLVSAKHTLTRDGVFNGVVARGQTTSSDVPAPTSQLIVDHDATSPTYWYGNFGQVVGFYDSSLLVNDVQCGAAALALLMNQIGLARSINYTQIVHPALEPGDVVAVVDPGTGVVERHLQDQLTIPLDAKTPMTAQTRSTTSDLPSALGPALEGASLS